MKNIWKLLGAFALLGVVLQGVHAAQTCNRTDFLCFESGPTASLLTPFRVDAAGNVTILGTESVSGVNTFGADTILGAGGTATSNLSTASNISLAVPILVSSNVSQGMAIVATTNLVSGSVNGIESTTSGATTVLGIADIAASSGAVVNVDFSGLAVALTSGTVTVGDLLVTTTTWPGYLVTNNSAAAGAIVGTALATNASTYNGLTRVLLHH